MAVTMRVRGRKISREEQNNKEAAACESEHGDNPVLHRYA